MTTNHLDALDPAVLRPGRADRIESIDYLDGDQAERLAALLPRQARSRVDRAGHQPQPPTADLTVDGQRLDREARLRQEIRAVLAVLADLRSYGITDSDLRNKCLAELWEMRDHELRRLMGAPKQAA